MRDGLRGSRQRNSGGHRANNHGAILCRPKRASQSRFGEFPTEEASALCQNFSTQAAVPIQNLNPDVLMVEPAEDWYRCDAAELLRPPKIRSVFIQ